MVVTRQSKEQETTERAQEKRDFENMDLVKQFLTCTKVHEVFSQKAASAQGSHPAGD